MLIETVCVSMMSLSSATSVTGQGGDSLPAGANRCGEIFGEIQSVLHEDYIGGQIIGSSEIIQSAFHEGMIMMSPSHDGNGETYLQVWTDVRALAEEWTQTPHPDYDVANFEILSVDVVDDRLATVLFKVEDRVYEALTLFRIEVEWRIVSKVFIEQ